MSPKYNCYYERDEKGIYIEVDTVSYKNLVGITFFQDFKAEGEVCLDEESIRSLILVLQSKLGE